MGPAVAASVAYVLGVSTHFTLNRYLNFRNFERAIHAQARTFTVIVLLSWALTIGIIMLGTHLGCGAIVAKVIAVIVNLPAGYIAHRYLTFGKGMRAAIRARSAARATARTEHVR
jgi:putative flippase GtrA